MATADGRTNTSKETISATTSSGKIVSSGNNYLPITILDGDNTYTLPDAVENDRKVFIIDNDSMDSIDITTVSSQTINGDGSVSIHSNNAITLISHNGNWRIISSHIT